METKLNGLSPANAISRNTKTKSVIKGFRPLDTYGDQVYVPLHMDVPEDLMRIEVRETLQEQIEAVIPRHWVYRRCIKFNESQRMDTLERQVAWIYNPSLEVIEMELLRIIRRLAK